MNTNHNMSNSQMPSGNPTAMPATNSLGTPSSGTPSSSNPSRSTAAKSNPLRPLRRPNRPSSSPMVLRPSQRSSQAPARPGASQPQQPATKSLEERRRMYNGWSEPPPPGCVDYPLIITKRDLKAGRRFHVMRFGAVADSHLKPTNEGVASVDPSDPNQFARPVALHRRDPQMRPPGRPDLHGQTDADSASAAGSSKPGGGQLSPEEEARLAQAKAEREAQRALDLAKIAPVVKDGTAGNKRAKKSGKQDKVTAVFQRPDESFKKDSLIHYEEALPWVLEDADNHNVWVGSYVGALSETAAALVIDGSSFRMIPLERYYRFKQKPTFTPYTIDQAENIMKTKADLGRWAMRNESNEEKRKTFEESRRALAGPSRVKAESRSFRESARSEKVDHDDLDMSGDEFQDDDENPTLERADDEETKFAQERIKRDQLGANLFGKADEQEIERQLEEERKEEEKRKVQGKAVRKLLLGRDHEDMYASDSDLESSSDEEEADEAESQEDKKPAVVKSLKRPASPSQAEADGSTSARKKPKKSQGAGSINGSAGNVNGTAKSKGNSSSSNVKRSAASPSAAGPGPGPGPGTPAATVSATASPMPAASVEAAKQPGGSTKAISVEEVINAMPPVGESIGVAALVRKFNGRIGGPGQPTKADLIKLITRVVDVGQDKQLRRRV